MFQNKKGSSCASHVSTGIEVTSGSVKERNDETNENPGKKSQSASKITRPSLPAQFRALLAELLLSEQDKNQKVDVSLYSKVVQNLQHWKKSDLNELVSPSERLISFVCNRKASTICRATSLAIMNQILLRILNRGDGVNEEVLKRLATALFNRKVVQELLQQLPKFLSEARNSKEKSRFLVDLCRYFIILCSFQKDSNETLRGLVEEVVNDAASHFEELLPSIDNVIVEPSSLDFRQIGQPEGDVRKHVLAMIEAILRWDGKHLHLQRCSDAFLAAAQSDRVKFLRVTSTADEASSKYVLWMAAQLAAKISTSDTLTKTDRHFEFVKNYCLPRFPKSEAESMSKLPPNLSETYSTFADLRKAIEERLQ